VPSDRNQALLEFYLTPNTLQATGDHFGVCRERVRQIIKEHWPEKLRKPGDKDWFKAKGGHRKSLSKKQADITKHPPWTKETIKYLLDHYGPDSGAVVAKHLGLTRNQVIGKFHRLKKIGIHTFADTGL